MILLCILTDSRSSFEAEWCQITKLTPDQYVAYLSPVNLEKNTDSGEDVFTLLSE